MNGIDFESYESNGTQYTMKNVIQEVAKEIETLSGTK